MDSLALSVDRARAGDREAFAALHGSLGAPLFLYLAGLLRRREDAEDAWQTAWLRAWTALPTLRRTDRFSPWLFRIARNAARDAARRARTRAGRPADEDLLAPETDVESGGEEEVRRLVAGLKPETRALVLLRAVHGWSPVDAAHAMGWSVATARRRYAAALSGMKARLEGTVTHDRRP
jgi:RNA polymerase sigma-70 factor (ECF subfamily)